MEGDKIQEVMRWTFFLVLLLMHNMEVAFGDDFTALQPSNDDCYKKGTIKAIDILNNNETSSTTVTERRINRDLLKEFLRSANFTAQPGSFEFVDWQDTSIKLGCNADATKWTVESRDTKYQKDFNGEKHSGTELHLEKPSNHLTFRKFTCQAKNCNHIFYVFTRPGVTVDTFPMLLGEGEEGKLTCYINPCIYKNKCPSKDQIVAHPYTFQWAFSDKEKEKYDVFHKDRKLYKEGDTLPPSLKNVVISKTTFKGSATVKTSNGDVTAANPEIGSTLTIKKAQDKNDGIYECVVTNGYGVVSTPDNDPREGLHDDVRYKGKLYVHVRSKVWTWIALGLCAGLIVLALAMNFACPTLKEPVEPTTEKIQAEVPSSS